MASTDASDWVELSITASRDDLNAAAEALGEFAPGAVWIEPVIETSDHRDFAYEFVDAPGAVRAAVETWTAEQEHALEQALARAGLAAQVSQRPLPQQNWAEEWKRFYHVLHAGERLVVRPSWEDYDAQPGEVVVILDPGSAFGTGQHPSTRLCLAALELELREGMRVIDVGTGSGILAVAAAALGAREVLAIDIDPDCVSATVENAARNGVASRIRAATGSLGDMWPWPKQPPRDADLVLANISSAFLISMLPQIAGALRTGGLFIGAGFIDESARAVRAAALAAGLEPLREDAEEEWRCLVARRRG